MIKGLLAVVLMGLAMPATAMAKQDTTHQRVRAKRHSMKRHARHIKRHVKNRAQHAHR